MLFGLPFPLEPSHFVWYLSFREFLPGRIIIRPFRGAGCFRFANSRNPLKPVTTHPSLMLRIQLVWRNAGSSMNSCQTAPRLSGSVRTYPRSGIADIESTERYRRRRWVTVIGWVMGCCPCLTCETHSCSRVLRGEKLLSGAGGMKVGSSPLPLGFVFVFAERRLRLNEARSGLVRLLLLS
jgi:hypothetical protein